MSDVDTVPSLPAALDPKQNAFAVKVNHQHTLGPPSPRRTSLPSAPRGEAFSAKDTDPGVGDGDGPPSPKADSEAETIIQSGRESLSPEKRRKFIKHEPKRRDDDANDRVSDNNFIETDVQVQKSHSVGDHSHAPRESETLQPSPPWREASPSVVKVEKSDDSQSISSRSEYSITAAPSGVSRKRSFSESIKGESNINRHRHRKVSPPLRSREEYDLSNIISLPRPASTDRSVSPIRQAHKRTASGPQLTGGNVTRKRKAPTPLITGFQRQSSEDRQSVSSANGSPLPSAQVRKLASVDGSSASPARPTNYKKLRDQNGRTRLARACAAQELEAVIARHEERPEDLNVPDNAGNTPLQIASLEGCAPIVKYLIGAGCEIETCNIDKDTPLIDAAENGHLDVVRILLEAGANPRVVNSQGNEPSDLVPDDCEEIRRVLEEAKAKPRPNRRSEETIAPSGRESSSRRISGASPRESPPVSGARSPPLFSAATTSKRKSVRSEATRNDLLWTKATPENLQAFAAKGDIVGVANILNVGQKADTDSMIAAAKGGHDEVLSLLLGMGDADPDPAPVESQKPGHNTPMLAAIGRGNLAVIKLFLDQPGFNPARRYYDGLTYFEISRKRRADNWEEEYDLLKEAYDKYVKSKKQRKSDLSSPRRVREKEKEGKRSARKDSPSPVPRSKKAAGSPEPRDSSSKDLGVSKERKGIAHPRDKSTPGVSRPKSSHLDLPDSDMKESSRHKPMSSDDVVKRRRLIAGRPPQDRDRKMPNLPSSDSLSGREDGAIKPRVDRSSEPASRTPTLKRGRSSASPERPRSRGSEAERQTDIQKKKRRVLSEEGAPNLANGGVKKARPATSDVIKSPPQQKGSAVSSDPKKDALQDSRLASSKVFDRDLVKEEQGKYEQRGLADIPMEDSDPVDPNTESQHKSPLSRSETSGENREPQSATSETFEQQMAEKAEQERLAEEVRINAEAERARAEKEEEERAVRAAQERAAEEERKRKEAEQRRIKQAEDERQKRLEQERQRLAKIRREQEEHEQRRRDALPSRLCIAANLVGSNDPQARAHSWLRRFMPVVTAETKQLDPNCGADVASERWVPNYLVAPLLATNDLQLSQYASWEKRDATPQQRMNLWRVTRRMLVQADDTEFLTASFGQIMQKDGETRSKYFGMEHIFWVKLSDFMDLVPHIPHLQGLDIRFLKMHIDQEPSGHPSFPLPQANGHIHGPSHADNPGLLLEQIHIPSDGEENAPVAAADEVEVSADAGTGGQMSVLDALKGVLRIALIHDGLARGLREAAKALDRRQAHMCVLNEGCEEEAYKKLVVALCSEHKIPLIKVPDGKLLGEWVGLCQLDREGNARKVVNCSCVVVKDWGEESQERSVLLNYFQTEQ
ncbi:putative histone deacetylase complex subunit (Hos4) [Aspergillus lucknowensis]|uniref:40S ribosomal protein S12 n=1 Tax=Aspergillus lucknowensis TaxID=176173 RepID=A0ABR4M3D5_9EURO